MWNALKLMAGSWMKHIKNGKKALPQLTRSLLIGELNIVSGIVFLLKQVVLIPSVTARDVIDCSKLEVE